MSYKITEHVTEENSTQNTYYNVRYTNIIRLYTKTKELDVNVIAHKRPDTERVSEIAWLSNTTVYAGYAR